MPWRRRWTRSPVPLQQAPQRFAWGRWPCHPSPDHPQKRSVAAGRSTKPRNGDPAIERLCRLALAYLDFATTCRPRWRAVFDHRLPAGKRVPDWYLDDQMRLFGYVEGPLGELLPGLPRSRRALLARSLFSAVHGLVTLGLEEKLQALAPGELREQVTFVVSALGRGLRESSG